MGKCESCVWYVYDEEYDDYLCDMDLDEDELARFLASDTRDCPYWRPGDERLRRSHIFFLRGLLTFSVGGSMMRL